MKQIKNKNCDVNYTTLSVNINGGKQVQKLAILVAFFLGMIEKKLT
jgi:hypothetical protein